MKVRIAAVVAALAVSLSLPGLSAANRGGVPNPHAKACVSKGKGTDRTPHNSRGKKCGFHK